MKKLVALIILSFFCAIFFSHAGNAIGAMENGKPAWKLQQKEGEKAYDLSTILVKFNEGVTSGKRKNLAKLVRGKFKDKNEDGIDDRFKNIMGGRLALIELEGVKGKDLASQALRAMQNHPLVEYAEHNYLHYIDSTPDDSSFNELWGLHNTGQTGGTEDADIDAPEAWDITTGSSEVIVGVIDTGVDYNHLDLAGNMWTNPGEDPDNGGIDGIDDDGNGYVDDIHGINAITGTGDPMDDHWHGTHCAGTIGAIGNNDEGVVGVNWKVSIIAVKFLDSGGSGTTADAIEAINYFLALKIKGVNIRVLSNSWGGGGYSEALYDAIGAAGDAGILFVAAAGNDGLDTDIFPHYPSSYDNANIVAVASTDHNDNLSWSSNYGATSVDLAAPGSSIFSTLPGNDYGTSSGTSMATPHVAGVAALMLSENNYLSVSKLKDNLMNTGDLIPELIDLCVSGKRLNAYNSLPPLWLSANPTSKSIPQGETATYTINVESVLGFSELVTLSASSDPPIRATIEFDPADSGYGYPGFSPYMKVITTTEDTNPNNYTVPGDYFITITGDSGSINKTTAVMLTVKPEGRITKRYSSEDTPIDIPDCADDLTPSEIDSTIEVPDSLNIYDPVVCEVHVTHTYIGDLIVKLIHPDGETEKILHREGEGGSADDIDKEYSLTEFIGKNSGGFWTLVVSDNFPRDVGTLVSWTLTIGGTPTFCGDGTCEPGEDSCTCPADCVEAPLAETGLCTDGVDNDCDGAIDCYDPDCDSDLACVCNNNGICEEDEDCNNCSNDCIGGSGGGTSCTTCWRGVCDGKCNPSKDGPDCADCALSYCCGDGTCEGDEDATNCAIDCAVACSSDADCDDGDACTVDTCDAVTGCANTPISCLPDETCIDGVCIAQPQCSAKNAPCTTDSECCSNWCHRGTCKNIRN